MSKKKKFKKFSKAEILEKIKKTADNNEDKMVFEEVKTDLPNSPIESTPITPISAALTETAYVKKDLKRVAVVLGFVFIILFVCIYLDKKTPLFNNFTDSLVKVLNLND